MPLDPSILSNIIASETVRLTFDRFRFNLFITPDISPEGTSIPATAAPFGGDFNVRVTLGLRNLPRAAAYLGGLAGAADAALNRTVDNFAVSAADMHKTAALDILENGHSEIPDNRGVYGLLKKAGALKALKTSTGAIVRAPASDHALGRIDGELERGISEGMVTLADDILNSKGEVQAVVDYDKPEYIVAITDGHRSTIPRSEEMKAFYAGVREEIGPNAVPRPPGAVPPRPFLALAEKDILPALEEVFSTLVTDLGQEIQRSAEADPGGLTPTGFADFILALEANRLLTFTQRNSSSVIIAMNQRLRRFTERGLKTGVAGGAQGESIRAFIQRKTRNGMLNQLRNLDRDHKRFGGIGVPVAVSGGNAPIPVEDIGGAGSIPVVGADGEARLAAASQFIIGQMAGEALRRRV